MNEKNLKIYPVKGYNQQIGIIVSELTNTRLKTLNLVKNLSIKELDHNFDKLNNSIGTLLLHIEALEFLFVVKNRYNRNFNTEELQKYKYAIPGMMIERKVNKNNIEYYEEGLNTSRKLLLSFLSTLDDSWLYTEIIRSNYTTNNYFLLKHLCNDEISHQGQIIWNLKRFP